MGVPALGWSGNTGKGSGGGSGWYGGAPGPARARQWGRRRKDGILGVARE